MIQIRKNVFETNSSSTHSIAIPRKLELPKERYEAWDWNDHINLGEFGWRFQSVNPVDYLYTALCCFDDQEKIEYFKKFLEEHRSGLNDHELDFDEPKYTKVNSADGTSWRYLANGYIDHLEELSCFIEDLFSDDDLLLKYITGAHIMTGNDNTSGDEADILENFEKKYRKKGYSIYRKGN